MVRVAASKSCLSSEQAGHVCHCISACVYGMVSVWYDMVGVLQMLALQ